MTTLEDIIDKSCKNYPGGVIGLAADLSINEQTLRNKCSARISSHKMNIREGLELMLGSTNVLILEALCRETHHACVPKLDFRNVSSMDLLNAWTTCDMEHGKTAQTIRDAMHDDHHIDKTEYQQIHGEMFTDFARELELLERLKHFHKSNNANKIDKLSLEEAIVATVPETDHAIADIAKGIKMREVDLRKKVNPSDQRNVFTIQQTLDLIRFTQNYLILHSMAYQLNHICVQIPFYDENPVHDDKSDMELLNAWSSWNDERSDTISLIHKSLKDKKIIEEELIKIEKEIYQDFHKELALLSRLKSTKGLNSTL